MIIEDNIAKRKQYKSKLMESLMIQIKRFEEWYQYAETVGQARLYNFLMSSSIILLTCAALIAANNPISYISAALLSGSGIFFSNKWIDFGERQAIFHDNFEENIRIRLVNLHEIDNFMRETLPVHQIMEMKDPNSKVILPGTRFYLSDRHRKVSTRSTLTSVPTYFYFVFLVTCAISIIGFTITAGLIIKNSQATDLDIFTSSLVII